MEVSGLGAPVALTPGKEPPVPIEQEARWATSGSKHSGEGKYLLTLPTFEPRISQAAAKWLYQLRYPALKFVAPAQGVWY